jgi:hypothetical protein
LRALKCVVAALFYVLFKSLFIIILRLGSVTVESNSVITSWRELNISRRYKRVLL